MNTNKIIHLIIRIVVLIFCYAVLQICGVGFLGVYPLKYYCTIVILLVLISTLLLFIRKIREKQNRINYLYQDLFENHHNALLMYFNDSYVFKKLEGYKCEEDTPFIPQNISLEPDFTSCQFKKLCYLKKDKILRDYAKSLAFEELIEMSKKYNHGYNIVKKKILGESNYLKPIGSYSFEKCVKILLLESVIKDNNGSEIIIPTINHPDRENDDIKYLFRFNPLPFYHFTDKENIMSICYYGGLFSWGVLHKNNITIPFQGGNSTSQLMDYKRNLQNYVRLSFNPLHPMQYRLEESGRSIVLLHINKGAVLNWADVLFSNTNANSRDVLIGNDTKFIKENDLMHPTSLYLKRDSPNFAKSQAEILVPYMIPKEEIINFNEVIENLIESEIRKRVRMV